MPTIALPNEEGHLSVHSRWDPEASRWLFYFTGKPSTTPTRGFFPPLLRCVLSSDSWVPSDPESPDDLFNIARFMSLYVYALLRPSYKHYRHEKEAPFSLCLKIRLCGGGASCSARPRTPEPLSSAMQRNNATQKQNNDIAPTPDAQPNEVVPIQSPPSPPTPPPPTPPPPPPPPPPYEYTRVFTSIHDFGKSEQEKTECEGSTFHRTALSVPKEKSDAILLDYIFASFATAPHFDKDACLEMAQFLYSHDADMVFKALKTILKKYSELVDVCEVHLHVLVQIFVQMPMEVDLSAHIMDLCDVVLMFMNRTINEKSTHIPMLCLWRSCSVLLYCASNGITSRNPDTHPILRELLSIANSNPELENEHENYIWFSLYRQHISRLMEPPQQTLRNITAQPNMYTMGFLLRKSSDRSEQISNLVNSMRTLLTESGSKIGTQIPLDFLHILFILIENTFFGTFEDLVMANQNYLQDALFGRYVVMLLSYSLAFSENGEVQDLHLRVLEEIIKDQKIWTQDFLLKDYALKTLHAWESSHPANTQNYSKRVVQFIDEYGLPDLKEKILGWKVPSKLEWNPHHLTKEASSTYPLLQKSQTALTCVEERISRYKKEEKKETTSHCVLKHFPLRRVKESIIEKTVVDVDTTLVQFVESEENIMLLVGELGSGKSTILGYMHSCMSKSNNAFDWIPVYITCNSGVSADRKIPFATELLNQLSDYLIQGGVDRVLIDILWRYVKLIAMIDNYHPFFNGTLSDLVHESSNNISVKFVIASEELKSLFDCGISNMYLLDSLTDEVVEKYITHCLSSKNQDFLVSTATRYTKIFHHNQSVYHMPRTPLAVNRFVEYCQQHLSRENNDANFFIDEFTFTVNLVKFIFETIVDKAQQFIPSMNPRIFLEELYKHHIFLSLSVDFRPTSATVGSGIWEVNRRPFEIVNESKGNDISTKSFDLMSATKIFELSPLLKQHEQNSFTPLNDIVRDYFIFLDLAQMIKTNIDITKLEMMDNIEYASYLFSMTSSKDYIWKGQHLFPGVLKFAATFIKTDDNVLEKVSELIRTQGEQVGPCELFFRATCFKIISMIRTFQNIDFENLTLDFFDFEGSRFSTCKFTSVTLSHANMRNAYFKECRFTKSLLKRVDFGWDAFYQVGFQVMFQKTLPQNNSIVAITSTRAFILGIESMNILFKSEDNFSGVSCVDALYIDDSHILVAYGMMDGSIKICNIYDSSSPIIMRGHKKTVRSVAFFDRTNPSTYLISVGDDGTVFLWNKITGLVENKSDESDMKFTNILTANQTRGSPQFLTTLVDGGVYHWDLLRMRVNRTISQTKYMSEMSTCSRDGRSYVFLVTQNNAIVEYDLQEGRAEDIWEIKASKVCKICSWLESRDQIIYVAAGTTDGCIALLNYDKKQMVKKFVAHTGALKQLNVLQEESGVGSFLISCGSDHVIRTWSIQRLLENGLIKDLTPRVLITINYLDKHKLLACGYQDGAIRLFDLDKEMRFAHAHYEKGPVNHILEVNTRDESLYLVTVSGCTMAKWDCRFKNVTSQTNIPVEYISSICTLNSNIGIPLVLFVCNDDFVRVWDAENWCMLRVIKNPHGNMNWISVIDIPQNESQMLVTGGQSGYICYWDISSISITDHHQYEVCSDTVYQIDTNCKNINGNLFVWSGEKMKLIVHGIRSNRETKSHEYWVSGDTTAVHFYSYGQESNENIGNIFEVSKFVVITGNINGEIEIRDLDRRILGKTKAHHGAVIYISSMILKMEPKIVSAGEDGVIRVWTLKYVEKVSNELSFELVLDLSSNDVLLAQNTFVNQCDGIEIFQKCLLESPPIPVLSKPPGNSLKELKSRAELGDLQSQLKFGLLNLKGKVIRKNEKIGLDWIRKAAENGLVEAQWQLAKYLFENLSQSESRKEGLSWFERAAENNHEDSLIQLGTIYEMGIGVDSDHDKAYLLYRKASNLGSAFGLAKSAYSLFHGIGTESNKEEAVVWYRKAAEKGHPVAQYNLACCYRDGIGIEKDLFEAFRYFKKSADQCNSDALSCLARCYEDGLGTDVDLRRAFQTYLLAADLGNSYAMNNLGLCYKNGVGTEKNEKLCFDWFKRAAELDQSDAQFNLAVLFHLGIYVQKNMSEALFWYEKAASNGSEAAMNNLGIIFEDGTGATQNYETALAWYKKAADKGFPPALFNIADMYEFGKGVAVDISQAINFYKQALDKNYSPARESLRRIAPEEHGDFSIGQQSGAE